MFQTNEATTVPEQDTNLTIENSDQTPVQHSPAQTPPTGDKRVVFVATGEYEDPRKPFTCRYVDDYGEITNAHGKLQRSIGTICQDGTRMLVSAFGGRTAELIGLALGSTYTFYGKHKTKTEPYNGTMSTSHFLNL